MAYIKKYNLPKHSSLISNSKYPIKYTLIFNTQIKNNQEFIRISYSNKEISSKIKFFDDSVIDVKITFDQNVPEED